MFKCCGRLGGRVIVSATFHSDCAYVYVHVDVCARVRACVCVRGSVCVRARACVCVCV
jgi:hypothetical protein